MPALYSLQPHAQQPEGASDCQHGSTDVRRSGDAVVWLTDPTTTSRKTWSSCCCVSRTRARSSADRLRPLKAAGSSSSRDRMRSTRRRRVGDSRDDREVLLGAGGAGGEEGEEKDRTEVAGLALCRSRVDAAVCIVGAAKRRLWRLVDDRRDTRLDWGGKEGELSHRKSSVGCNCADGRRATVRWHRTHCI